MSHANICFDCKKSTGGCSWSALDPDTLRPMFKPVEGWTAKPIIMDLGISYGKRRTTPTYHITACPLFEPDEPRLHRSRRGEWR